MIKKAITSEITKKNPRATAKQKIHKTLVKQKAHPTKRAGDRCDYGGQLCKTNKKRTPKTLHCNKQVYYTRVQIFGNC